MPPPRPQPPEPSASPAEAIAGGYFAQVRFLLQLDAAGANSREPLLGRTPLILCCLVRDDSWAASLARLLLEHGAKVGLKDRRGLNALHYACACARPQLCRLFLDAIDYRVDERDRRGNTPLHYAVAAGCPQTVGQLVRALQRFQLPLQLANDDGMTPLMLAYRHQRFEAAELLLAGGADTDAVDAFGKSTLAYEREALASRRVAEEALEARRGGRRLRFDDVDGWRRQQLRLRSAPPPRASRTFKEQLQESRRDQLQLPHESEFISCALPIDRRNDPVEVFRASALDVFGREASAAGHVLVLSGSAIRPASARYQQQHQQHQQQQQHQHHQQQQQQHHQQQQRRRARSALPAATQRVRIAVPADDGRLTPGAASVDSAARSEDSRCLQQQLPPAASVKANIPVLFRNLEFHCSQLYRPPPAQPDPQLHVHDLSSRFLLPPAGDGVDGSDHTTPTGRRRKEAGKKQKKSTASDVKKKPGRISRAAFNRDD